jgi:hypothetical protein
MPPSRIHELARMDTTALRGLYLRLVQPNGGGNGPSQQAAGSWDRDRLITGIRNIEAPDNGRTAARIRFLAMR